MFSLTNKIVWVTGASQGIGAALCSELISRGAKVAMTARTASALTTLEEKHRGSAFAYPGDVTSQEVMSAIAQRIEQEVGAIDILIANAGSCFYLTPETFKSSECLELMNLNYGGALRCIEAVLPRMLQRSAGRIVGVASLAGLRGLPKAAAYGASKAALIHFLESMRYHCERKGIGITVVNPGFVKTPLTDVNPFPMPSLISPEEAARSICNGIEREKNEITFPFAFAHFMKFLRVIPYPLYSRIVALCWKRLGFV